MYTLEEIYAMSQEEQDKLTIADWEEAERNAENGNNPDDAPNSDHGDSDDHNKEDKDQPNEDPDDDGEGDEFDEDNPNPNGEEDDPEDESGAGEGGNEGDEDDEGAGSEELSPTDAILHEAYKVLGQEVQVKDPQDIRRLVQRGLTAESEIEALRGDATLGATLKKVGIPVDKLGLVKDVLAGNPTAIAKLVKDFEIDLYEQEEEAIAAYKPSEVEVEAPQANTFKTFHSQNAGNAEYDHVFQVANTMDDDSTNALIQNPNMLLVLADHQKQGIFDDLMAEVRHARLVKGDKRPMLQIYDEIGRAKHSGAAPKGADTPKSKSVIPKRTKQVDPELERKRALVRGQSKSKARNSTLENITAADVHSMSDKDFDQLSPDMMV